MLQVWRKLRKEVQQWKNLKLSHSALGYQNIVWWNGISENSFALSANGRPVVCEEFKADDTADKHLSGEKETK